MAYASVQDLIDRFGSTEIIRLSRPEDRTAETVDGAKVQTALVDASSTLDGYLRDRYVLPIADPPKDIVRAVCVLARHDLASSGRSDPTDQMVEARKEVIAWLKAISDGIVRLDAPKAGAQDGNPNGSGARISDREKTFSGDNLGAW